MATVHARPKLVASYFWREKKAFLFFSSLSLITQQRRGETFCLIIFDKMMDNVGKSEMNWLQMWIKFLES